ncbi:DUF4124 domain-containing protein [Marinicella rhabdoformis]|uniref:DUF4124 domain-containing protein n=1 Tax=Marinicella rhabdoformis TaxID=2580566 RepID=UPI0012AEC8A0|nr:DUF4124 domain-containing protein [Marinicella rhabdoformis]
MKKFALVCLVLLSSLAIAGTTLYKYTDPNGVTHYSQTKIDDRYEAVEAQPVSVVPSQLKTTPNPKVNEEKEVSSKELIKSFKLTKPKQEENLWGTGLSVTASVDVEPGLLEIYDIQYVIDGKSKPANSRATQKFENIYRGEHKIYGQLVEKGSNRVVKKTQVVTFFMHQQSKK